MSELENCPFCGGESEWSKGMDDDGNDFDYICCSKCEAMGFTYSRKREGLIKAWNTRKKPIPKPEITYKPYLDIKIPE